MHVIECAKLGADVMTGPLSAIEGLMKHPLTDIGLAKFWPTTRSPTADRRSASRMAHLVKLHDHNPDPRKVREVVDVLHNNGLIVCPTDTVYSFAAKLGSSRGSTGLPAPKG